MSIGSEKRHIIYMCFFVFTDGCLNWIEWNKCLVCGVDKLSAILYHTFVE